MLAVGARDGREDPKVSDAQDANQEKRRELLA